eukprot:SAG22_NODE_1218_length_5138_cov_4.648938_4_plen_150_part_00
MPSVCLSVCLSVCPSGGGDQLAGVFQTPFQSQPLDLVSSKAPSPLVLPLDLWLRQCLSVLSVCLPVLQCTEAFYPARRGRIDRLLAELRAMPPEAERWAARLAPRWAMRGCCCAGVNWDILPEAQLAEVAAAIGGVSSKALSSCCAPAS